MSEIDRIKLFETEYRLGSPILGGIVVLAEQMHRGYTDRPDLDGYVLAHAFPTGVDAEDDHVGLCEGVLQWECENVWPADVELCNECWKALRLLNSVQRIAWPEEHKNYNER